MNFRFFSLSIVLLKDLFWASAIISYQKISSQNLLNFASKGRVKVKINEKLDRMRAEEEKIANNVHIAVLDVHVNVQHVQDHAKRVNEIAKYINETKHHGHESKAGFFFVH
jgi:hypothetical protein